MDKDRAKHKRDLIKKHEQEKHARKAQGNPEAASVSGVVAASRQKQLHRKV